MSVRFGSTGFCDRALGQALAIAQLTSIIGIVGCASPRLRLDAATEPPGTSFHGVYDRWTRDGSVVSWDEMDTTLLVSATLRSRSFQRAYVDRYLKLYRIDDPAERARIEQTEGDVADSGLNFWVRTSCHSVKWNDLNPQRGRWRILLIDPEGKEVQAEQISPVGRTEGLELALFDQRPDVYGRLWHVRFPPLSPPTSGRPAAERKLTLRFSGPNGKTDLVWLVE